jgi:tRNA(Ile)-lysidine synthase
VNRLVGEVEADILERGLLPDGQRVLVAVSGGVDSVVLLEILHRLAGRHRWDLVVAHFNHQLRGRQSDGDERFVRSLAVRLGLGCVVGRDGVAGRARRRGVSVEMAGRDARHEFLAAAARDQKADTVALAHHADDQVELFLLRLLRGAGAEGLGGMKWAGASPADSGVCLVRPLLQRRKEVLIHFARSWSISFRPDRTNDSSDILRNRIRNELIPLLRKQYQPGLVDLILRQSELCGADAEFLTEQAKRWLAVRRPKFSRLPTALQRRVVLEQLLQFGIEPEFEKVEALRQEPDRPVQIREGVVIRRTADGVVGRAKWVRRPDSGIAERSLAVSVKLTGASGKVSLGRYRIEWAVRTGKAPAVTRRTAGREWFDADKVGSVVELRTRRAGDRFQPLGMPAPCKLQDLLTNARIPREQRAELLVALDEDGVMWWVDGLRIGEGHKVRVDTRRFLRWRWSLIK